MTHSSTISTLPIFLSNNSADELTLANNIARKWGFTVTHSQPNGLYLVLEQQALGLKDNDFPNEKAVAVDFASDALTYRRKHGGGKQESIAKAVGVKGQLTPSVIDATGGLGRDAFVLASLGCNVTLIERSPIVAALLDNGLMRAALHPATSDWLPERLSLQHGDSRTILTQWSAPKPDVVYLDPMFPHKKKSALVKKEMRAFQKLLGGDLDADQLLISAQQCANKRVVVKRPASADFLANMPPSASITSKKHRFDLYVSNNNNI